MVHRINIFLLSIILVIAQVITMNQALAAGLNGWTLQNPIAKGASVAYEGIKNVIINGKNVAKTSTALITPTASQVAKLLGKGVAGVALSVAVEELLGAVDWVLDPENSMIRYKEKGDDKNCIINSDCPDSQFLWKARDLDMTIPFFENRDQAEAICKKYKPVGAGDFRRLSDFSIFSFNCAYGGDVGGSYWSRLENPAYDPNAQPESKPEKSIPLDVVAAKVISNAEAGDSDAKVATTAAAADIVNDAQKDDAKARPIVNQLEANSKTETDADANTATGSQTQNPTKPNTTDLSLEFPTFCGWAPQVCEAAQVVINFPTTLTDWWNTGKSKAESWAQSISQAWTATKEWMNKEDTPEQTTEVDIDQTVPVVPNTSYFNWGAYCPFSPGSQTISLENTSAGIDYDLTSWCELAADLRPFVLAAGALMSFLIASGVIMGRDD